MIATDPGADAGAECSGWATPNDADGTRTTFHRRCRFDGAVIGACVEVTDRVRAIEQARSLGLDTSGLRGSIDRHLGALGVEPILWPENRK